MNSSNIKEDSHNEDLKKTKKHTTLIESSASIFQKFKTHKNLIEKNNDTTKTKIKSHSNSNDYKHKFYLARLKHGIIISFLALIPVQNFILCIISNSFEIVSVKNIIKL